MDTMNRVDAIYQRHVAVLERIGACGDAVRLSLRLALEELEERARGEERGAASLDDRTAAFHQMTQIGAWLAKHADGRGEGMEIADAMIAFAEDRLAVIRALTRQLEEMGQRLRREAKHTIAAEKSAGLPVLATVEGETNGSHANPPYVPDNIDDIRFSKWLRDDDRDWLEGLERGAHSFRMIPKETRRRLVQAHVDAVRMDSETPRQFDFDQARPTWMPTAGSAAATFGVSWGDLCAAKDLPY